MDLWLDIGQVFLAFLCIGREKNAGKERAQISSILTEQARPINESFDEILQCDYLKETPLEVSFT